MTAAPPGTPWQAWAIIAALVVIGPIVTTLLVARMQRPVQRQIAEVRNQVQNSHSANLRDDLDEKFALVLSGQNRLEEGQRRHDAELSEVRKDNRLTRERVEAVHEEQAGRYTELSSALLAHLKQA